AEDFDQCEWEDPQTLLITLLINDPAQSKPVIFESNNPDKDSLQFDYLLRQTARHNIRGFDEDKDLIKLTANGINFDFQSVNFIFPDAEAEENVFSDVLWEIACDFDLQMQDSLTVQFFVEDVDACQFTNRDTLTVDFLLGPPPSEKPELEFRSLNEIEFNQDSASVIVGNTVSLRLTGKEFERDSLELVMVSEPPAGLEFEAVKGLNLVSSDLNWDIDCGIFTDRSFNESITLDFVLFDKNCFLPQSDTLSLKVNIKDIPQRNEFAITNVITPRTSPDQNDYFGYYTIENPTEDDRLIYLPIDNCAGEFEEVIIHNRWGQTVFSSTNRDFKWFANDVSAGIYYYTILYSNSKYQGPLTVLF
ncbi:MAG: gliding motility-associated C-terminal domain-containing protein, partial [Bacteroidota bacterium]